MSPAPPLTCLIIDDNEMNRLTLEHFVALTASLTLVASLGGGLAGLQYLKDHPRVDLLLLDIEMPHLSGLDLVRLLPPPLPAVILIPRTASSPWTPSTCGWPTTWSSPWNTPGFCWP